MFEVAFSEIVLIAIIALLVVGPQEFPTLVRNIGSWLGKARHFMSAVKTEFEREIHKADEIKRLIAKEVEIAELHKTLDEGRRADRPSSTVGGKEPYVAEAGAPSINPGDAAASAAKQDHGKPQA